MKIKTLLLSIKFDVEHYNVCSVFLDPMDFGFTWFMNDYSNITCMKDNKSDIENEKMKDIYIHLYFDISLSMYM